MKAFCKIFLLTMIFVLAMSTLCACSAPADQTSQDDSASLEGTFDGLVFPSDLEGIYPLRLTSRPLLWFDDRANLKLRNESEDGDYVLFYLRPVTEADTKPWELLKIDSRAPMRKTRDALIREISLPNNADLLSDRVIIEVQDQNGLRTYSLKHKERGFPCIPIAKLYRGEETELCVWAQDVWLPDGEETFSEEEKQELPQIQYALFAIECYEPESGLTINPIINTPPGETREEGKPYEAGEAVMVGIQYENTGKAALTDIFIYKQYGNKDGWLIVEEIFPKHPLAPRPAEAASRYILTEEDIERGYIEMKLYVSYGVENPDVMEQYSFTQTGRIPLSP